MKPFLIAICLFGFSGCEDFSIGPGPSDFVVALPNGFFVHRTSQHQISIQQSATVNNGAGIEIPSKVVLVDSDDRFVIVQQQVLEARSSQFPNGYEQPVPDSFKYWILDTRTPQLVGPLVMDEFQTERLRLKVPDDLVLRDVSAFVLKARK